MDSVSKEVRSRIMSSIRGKDTQPELAVRRFLHRHGFRFRLHVRDLPGRPDVVLPKHRLVIFVHGCFWHRHAGCRLATMPAQNVEDWTRKFSLNLERDQRQLQALNDLGWRTFVIWECALRGDVEASLKTLPKAVLSGGSRRWIWPSA